MKDKLLDRIIRFDKLLGITALLIAFGAAFFSVYGISTLFAGAFKATAIMASSLEIGKIVAVTFLYRYWCKVQFLLKSYLILAIFVLMLVTSLGIFGYLSAAYQKSSLEFKANQEKIVMIESQKPFYTNLIVQSESRIKILSEARISQEARLSDALTNAFLSRNPLQLRQLQDQTISLITQADENIKNENEQIKLNQEKIMTINEEVNEMKVVSIGSKDIRTFQFVAEQFNMPLDQVAKWFIIILIFVFDPLAIALILGYNIAVGKKTEIINQNLSDKIENTRSIPPEIIIPSIPEPSIPEPSIPEPSIPEPSIPEIKQEILQDIPQKPKKILEKEDDTLDPYWKRMFKR
jgi:flagellar basal body-associated protein FliL